MESRGWTIPLTLTVALALASSVPALAFGRKPLPIHSNTVISDSLVKNLQCSTLSESTVLANLQPNAFDPSRNLQISNWPDVIGIGHCWALARAQRLVYFLGRLDGDPIPQVAPATTQVNDVSKMFRSPLASLVVFQETGDVGQFFSDGTRLRGDIDFYQLARFANPSNLGMLAGWEDRSKSDNAETFARIQADLAKNWLPILVLRINPFEQHVVLVKQISAPDSDGNVAMAVYDSNDPYEDVQMTYSSHDQEFYPADYIMEALGTSAPVGVFLSDEDEMQGIQDTLLTYYANQCQLTK